MMLQLASVEKRLGGRTVLGGLDLRAAPGEVVVVTGDNGAGKTTLLRVVAGLIQPDRGSVSICGVSLTREPVRAKAHLGYVPDALDAFPELLVSELCTLVTALKHTGRGGSPPVAPGLRERLGVHAIWGQRLRSLSFGQSKRVALYAALIGEPGLLVLDEPSNGLDPGGVELLRELIDERRRRALTALLSTNDAELAGSLGATRYHLLGGELVAR